MKSIYYAVAVAVAVIAATMIPAPVYAQSCTELGNCTWNSTAPLENFATPYTDVFGTILFPLIVYGIILTLIILTTKSIALTTTAGLVFLSFINVSSLGAWGSAVYYGGLFAFAAVGTLLARIFKKASAESTEL